jgi:hypothetical protein
MDDKHSNLIDQYFSEVLNDNQSKINNSQMKFDVIKNRKGE